MPLFLQRSESADEKKSYLFKLDFGFKIFKILFSIYILTCILGCFRILRFRFVR